MPDPAGRRVWIIGASDGIGAALARHMAGQGARLILSARSADRLRGLAAELGSAPQVVAADIADFDDLARAGAEIARGGPLDAVIHLAAQYDPGRIDAIDPARAAQIVTVNLTGSFNVARIAPGLLRDGGQLALCGSVAGYIGLPQGQIYSATKAGVINLTETLRAELAPRIDVRLICPGFVRTRLTAMNDFDMPFLLSPEAAAAAIVHGLAGRAFEVHFPRRFTLVMKLLRALPYALSLRLTRRLVR